LGGLGVSGSHDAKPLSNRMVQLREFGFIAGGQSIVCFYAFHHIGLNFVAVTIDLEKIQLSIR
jgi:hypothetical protein